jgi:DNA-binding GntR family transcriptional regulator
MPDSDSISRSVLAEMVKDRLLQDILSGRYAPHSRIVETAVARELGTSQAPVREALRGLEALGVVEIAPFRGARVRRPTTRELMEAYAVRAELESLGARLGVPLMSDADLEEIEEYGLAMERAAVLGDRHAVAIADASLHARIIDMTGNATLRRVWQTLEPFSRTYITLVAPGADAQWTADLHVGILAGLRMRDPALVEAALRRHFEEAGTKLSGTWMEEEAPAAPVDRRRRVRADAGPPPGPGAG